MADIDQIKAGLQRELDGLKQTRDELKLKLHLAAADARDEFHKLESRWDQIENELNKIATHAKEPIGEMGQAAKGLAEELKQGYARIKQQIKGQ